MVKNFGGNKAKRQGRKHIIAPVQTKLRLVDPRGNGEMYAITTKVLGNGMMFVKCLDKNERLCIIRKKFKGRGKRDNYIHVGTMVLVGLRTWATDVSLKNENEKEKCDLLEVYSDAEKTRLLQREKDTDFSVFAEFNKSGVNEFGGNDNIEGGFIFTNESDSENEIIGVPSRERKQRFAEKKYREENDNKSDDSYSESSFDFDDL